MSISHFFQHPINVRLTKILPFCCLRIYFYLLGFIYFSFNRDHRGRILQGLAIGRVSLISSIRTFLGIIDHYFEKMVMAHRPLSEMIRFLRPRLHIKNKGYMDKVVDGGKGCIFVTGHFGAVEFLGLSLVLNNYKVALVCRFKTEKLKEELTKRAQRFDFLLIDASETRVMFRALQAIKDGRVLITECDAFSAWRSSDKRISVFGHTVPQDKILDFLHRRAKVPVLMGLMRRDGSKFVLHISPLRGLCIGSAWNRLEKYISLVPWQWYQWGGLGTFLNRRPPT